MRIIQGVANTAKRRTGLLVCVAHSVIIAALVTSFGVASAFMSPRTNIRATPTRTFIKPMAQTRSIGRIRSAKSFEFAHLLASVTSQHSSASKADGEVIIASASVSNDTVPYFMSLDDKATGEHISRAITDGAVQDLTQFLIDEEKQHNVYPSIAISYDTQGMVQADAIVKGALVAGSYESEDYPAFIIFLYKKDGNGQTVASKLFNFALLAISFSYVFFSVFTIDKGMTRGWTPGEISLRIPLDTWASYENSLSEKPVATKTIINVVIYLLGDWLSQTLFQGKNVLDFDAARTIKNGFIGMCFGPAVHEYYEFSDYILPVEGATFGVTNRAFKILMDQTIYLAVKCSIYIVAIGVLNGDTIGNSTENVKNRLKPIMFTAWKFWPLVHCVTYGLIPARHRILWVNSVDLVWNAILASKARDDGDGGETKTHEEEETTNRRTQKGDTKGALDLSTIMKEVVIEMEGQAPNFNMTSTLLTESSVIGRNDNIRGNE
jgi:protein Mpv17